MLYRDLPDFIVAGMVMQHCLLKKVLGELLFSPYKMNSTDAAIFLLPSACTFSMGFTATQRPGNGSLCGKDGRAGRHRVQPEALPELLHQPGSVLLDFPSGRC